VLEPKGDLVRGLLGRIPPERISDVVLISPDDTGRSVGINPLELWPGGDRYLVADNVLAIFRRIYERFWGDPDQHPSPTMVPISRPPFYALPLNRSHAGCRGGVVHTTDAEVVRLDGGTIPGLYACGNAAANLLFGGGYGSGSAVGSSIVFGHLAALHAARS